MKKLIVIYFFILLFLLSGWDLFLSGQQDSNTKWKWQVDDLLTTDRVSEYHLSPDGKQLVWTITRWNLEEQKKFNILYLTRLTEKKSGK